MWIFYEVLWYLEQIHDPKKGKQKDTKEFCQSILKGKANGLGSPQVSTPSTPLPWPPHEISLRASGANTYSHLCRGLAPVRDFPHHI